MTSHDDLVAAAHTVHAVMPPTPQYRWPLLEALVAPKPDDGTELWVKHENHTPVGAFKIRGGIVYFERLLARGERPAGVVSATRGNHGQSIGFAARRHGIPALIVVPRGNSREKNAAMRALGVDLVEHGEDFQAAREHAHDLAADRGWLMVPSFHPDLVAGVASYALELFSEVPRLDTVYCTSLLRRSFPRTKYGRGVTIAMPPIGAAHSLMTTAPTSNCKRACFEIRRRTRFSNPRTA